LVLSNIEYGHMVSLMWSPTLVLEDSKEKWNIISWRWT